MDWLFELHMCIKTTYLASGEGIDLIVYPSLDLVWKNEVVSHCLGVVVCCCYVL